MKLSDQLRHPRVGRGRYHYYCLPSLIHGLPTHFRTSVRECRWLIPPLPRHLSAHPRGRADLRLGLYGSPLVDQRLVQALVRRRYLGLRRSDRVERFQRGDVLGQPACVGDLLDVLAIGRVGGILLSGGAGQPQVLSNASMTSASMRPRSLPSYVQ